MTVWRCIMFIVKLMKNSKQCYLVINLAIILCLFMDKTVAAQYRDKPTHFLFSQYVVMYFILIFLYSSTPD